jgi:energy-coupling factor transporter ATP-binding protein EcfA2
MAEPIIRVEALEHVYPNGARALRGVSLEVQAGEFVGVIGQNGSGKTTLVKHFNGLLKPTAGRVIVKGRDTRTCHVSDLARSVGYVFQNPDHQIFSRTVLDELAFGPRNLKMDRATLRRNVEEAIEIMGLQGLEDKHPFLLSRGQRQRLAIASVLAMKTEVLILDEPTGGQDREQVQRLEEALLALHQSGHTILLVTHDLEVLAEVVRRAIAVYQGQVLLDGEPREVFRETDKLAQTFLKPPQITQLSAAVGCDTLALSVDEMVERLRSRSAMPASEGA